MLFFILLSVGSFSFDSGASGADTDRVSVFVMEGDSVTLYPGFVKTQQDRIKWYYNDIRIAQINGDLNKTCTDVQCNEGTERFRGRLKLDHQTGSLTITYITNTHSGEYKLKIFSSSSDSEKIFSLSVHDVPAAERDEIKKNKGESLTLDAGEKKLNGVIMWCFNGLCFAEIHGDQSKIYTDVQCNERFSDRLKLDHQTGSLTITNTTTEDSGEYRVWTSSSSRHRRSISKNVKSFYVTVIDFVPDSGHSSGAAAGVSVVAFLVVAVAIYYRHRSFRNDLRHGSHSVASDIN